MKRAIISFACALSLPFALTSQNTFLKTIGGPGDEAAHAAIETTDGNYLIAGYTTSYGSGGQDGFLLKIDPSGTELWSKAIGGSNDDAFQNLIQLPDGGIMTVGWTESSGAGNDDAWITRMDESGNIVWSKTYGGTGDDHGYSLLATSDGNILVAGYTKSFGNGYFDILVLKIDPNGNTVWEKYYGHHDFDYGHDWFEGSNIIENSAGNYIIPAVWTYGIGIPEHNGVILELDSSGEILFSKIYGGSDNEGFTGIRESNGAYQVMGSAWSWATGEHGVWMNEIGLDGNINWSRKITLPGQNIRTSSTVFKENGEFIISAYYNSPIPTGNALIMKVGSSGELAWARSYGGGGEESVYTLLENNNGFIAFGFTDSYGKGGKDILILQTDQQGNVPGCSSPVDLTITEVAPSTATPDPGTGIFPPGQSISPATAVVAFDEAIICTPPMCDYYDNYNHTDGWTQVGTDVTIANGRVEYQDGSADGEQRRIYKGLGVSLDSNDTWTAEIGFTPSSFGSYQGQPMAGHNLLALTAGIQEPLNDCPDTPCTGNPTGTQDGIMIVCGTYNPPDGSTFFLITARDGALEFQSDRIFFNTLNTTYYLKLERTGETEVQLSVFTDPGRTIPLPGSPVTLAIPSTITGLTTVQHTNHARGMVLRQLTGTVDNLCINWEMAAPPPIADFELSRDTICQGQCISLTNTSSNMESWQWAFTGANLDSTNTRDPENICFTESGTDTILLIVSNPLGADTLIRTISVLPYPEIGLGNDTMICSGQSLTLDATFPGAAYLWTDGSTGPVLAVSSGGVFAVEASVWQCAVRDTIQITTLAPPTVDLGQDTALCSGNSISLNATHPFATEYLWQDGSTLPTFEAAAPGAYYVTASNNCGAASDTLKLAEIEPVAAVKLGPGRVLCQGDTLLLDATTDNGLAYEWNDGLRSAVRLVTTGGMYQVTVRNDCSEANAQVEITGENCCRFYLPDAFSPNSDGVNDEFRAYYSADNCKNVTFFSLKVFSRWGELVFETNDIGAGWDGAVRGKKAVAGVYAWTLEYRDGALGHYFEKGDVVIFK